MQEGRSVQISACCWVGLACEFRLTWARRRVRESERKRERKMAEVGEREGLHCYCSLVNNIH